jgi:hypothetical protein
VLRDFSHAFHFGSIAADTFFYGVRVPFLDRAFACCGDRIHGAKGNDTSLPILQMLHELRENPEDSLLPEKLAFICGFLTHIALDTVMHPCIYYYSGNYYHENPKERALATTRHRLIETWLDLFLLRKISSSIDDFSCIKTIRRNSSLNLDLLRFFFQAFVRTDGVDEYLWKYLHRGYNVQMFLNSIYPDASWGKLVGAANRILKGKLDTFMALFYPWDYRDIPPEVIDFESYRHPITGEELPVSFNDLWKTARKRSLEFLEAVRLYLYHDGDHDQLGNIIKGYSLCMGLVGVSATDAGYFDGLPMNRIWIY